MVTGQLYDERKQSFAILLFCNLQIFLTIHTDDLKVDGEFVDTHDCYWHRDTPNKVRQELMLNMRVSPLPSLLSLVSMRTRS